MKATANINRFLHRYRESAIDILILFLLVQAGSIIYSLAYPNDFRYLTTPNISVMLKAIPVLGVLGLGVGVLMISGEFDLSVGANYTFAGIVMAKQVENGMSVYLAAPLAIGVGTGIGLINGFVTIRFAIPSFITTLGSSLFWQGFTLFYHGATSMRFRPGPTFTNLMAGNIGLMQASFLWFIGLAIVFWALLHHHKLGNHFYAVGGNKRAATAIGINPNRVKLIAFGMAGACAALAGILAASRVGAIQPGQGRGLELQAIAACVIGGVALTGGRGSILGMALGAALIYTIQDILLLARAPGFYLDIFVGLLIVGAAIFNQMIRRQQKNE
ncbi:MAG TPA: ABC transporter permease [Aggregatilineaceae bacterium]|nr:ABC transporter permease [Aggregatilineaceae bacterium]